MLIYTHTLAAGLLVGKVALLSFVVAPILARELDAVSFGRVVRHLFPAYYAMGMIAALLGLLALGGLGVAQGLTAVVAGGSGLWLIVLATEAYCRVPLTLRSNRMRDEIREQELRGDVDPQLQAAWERLHRRSVSLNSLVSLIGLSVLGVSTILMK